MRRIPCLNFSISFGQGLSIALLFAIVAGAGLYVRSASRAQTQPSSSASTQTSRSDLEVELVTLRPHGFEPAEIERPKGPFVLFVDDRSGREGSSLTLQRVKGDRLRDLNTNNKKSEGYDVVDLPPGDYVLTDATNSESRFQITIRP